MSKKKTKTIKEVEEKEKKSIDDQLSEIYQKCEDLTRRTFNPLRDQYKTLRRAVEIGGITEEEGLEKLSYMYERTCEIIRKNIDELSKGYLDLAQAVKSVKTENIDAYGVHPFRPVSLTAKVREFHADIVPSFAEKFVGKKAVSTERDDSYMRLVSTLNSLRYRIGIPEILDERPLNREIHSDERITRRILGWSLSGLLILGTSLILNGEGWGIGFVIPGFGGTMICYKNSKPRTNLKKLYNKLLKVAEIADEKLKILYRE